MAVAGGPERRLDLVGAVERVLEVLLGDLQAPEDAVVADADDPEPQLADSGLGAVDPRERLRGDRGSVRDARGEARRRRLVRARDPELPGERADVGLARPHLEQRMAHAVLGRRAQPGPPVRGVVRVGARQQHAEAAAGGEGAEGGVQLGLAEVAAVGAVPAVAVARELVGGDDLVSDPDRAGHAAGAVELAGRDGGRDRGDGERPLAEGARGDGGDQGRVHAARERHDRVPEVAHAALQLGEEGPAHWTASSCAAASARAQIALTGAPTMRAARSQSPCSGARLTTCPSRRPTLTRTGSPATSTVRLSRSSSIRSSRAMRTPSELVSRKSACATACSSLGRASADSTKPGRPRFICAGDVQTSSAPAAKHAAAASGASSGSRSSRLASISETRPAPAGVATPTIARTTFGIASKSRLPAP